MARYETRAARWSTPLENEAHDQPLTVWATADDAHPTGLLDHRGREIWRVREPAGFDTTPTTKGSKL